LYNRYHTRPPMYFRKLKLPRMSPDELLDALKKYKDEYKILERPVYIISHHYKDTTQFYIYDKLTIHTPKARSATYNIKPRTCVKTQNDLNRKERKDKGGSHIVTKPRSDKGKSRPRNVNMHTYTAMIKLLSENGINHDSINMNDVRKALVA
jgi:hypothetical protein